VKQFVKATCFVNCLPTPALGAALAGAGAADAPYFSDSPAVANGYRYAIRTTWQDTQVQLGHCIPYALTV